MQGLEGAGGLLVCLFLLLNIGCYAVICFWELQGEGSVGVASATELREGLQHFEAAQLP